MAHFGKDLDSFSASRTVRILSSESAENYTVYLIEVSVGPYSWTVKHRYSDFHDLHDKLVSTCKLDKNLLPPKKLFGNQSETFIKKRQGELEVYLQTVLYYLAHRVPPILAFFLHFNKYEIHGITQALAEELYNRGETILLSHEMFQMSPLQLHALTERLKLPEPTCGTLTMLKKSGDVKKDIGHILDFITRMKRLKICGSKESVGSSNIDMNQLTFDLTLFKSIQYLEILNCSPRNIVGLETIKQTLKEFQLCRSTKTIREFLLQDIPAWRGEDGTLLVSYWELVEEADMSHNFIVDIDDSVQLMPKVEHLDLSHNQLTSIQHLQWLSHLTFLDISHNNIHNLDSLHTKLGNLKTLKLAGNKLGSLQGFSKLFSLEILDVSNNEIGQVSDVKPIGGLPCLENLLLTGNPVTIVLDYRTKVLEVFGDRVNEVVLDKQKPSQKELDTVAVLQALQKARDNKDKVKRLTPKKTASSASLTDSEYSRTPPNLSGEARNGTTSPSSVDLRHGSTQALSGSPLCSSYNGFSSSPFFRPEHTGLSSSPLSRTERAGLSSSPLSRTEQAGLSSSPMFRSELSSSSVTGPAHPRPVSSPVTRAEQAGLTHSSLTGPAHPGPISSHVTRPEDAGQSSSPSSRPEEMGMRNSPPMDLSSSSPPTRLAQMGISRYEQIDGLTTFTQQEPTLSSPDMAQLSTVTTAADTKHFINTADNDKQPADNDKQPADNDKQPADNDKQPADNDKQPDDNDKQPADNDKQPADNDKQPADNVKQPVNNDKQPADNDKQPADNDKQPADNDKQPADNVKQPVNNDKQPADNDKQPADNDIQPADNDIQPTDKAPGERLFTIGSGESGDKSIQPPSDKTKSTVINYADLPSGANTEFRNWLQKHLIGGGSPSRESTQENILDILWCNAVQYSNPTVFFSCCAVLTKSKIFIERLTDLDSGLPGVPDFEPFYILPMCNIQQIVLGCCLAYVKLEESFVGKMGTFILIGLDPSVLKTFVESFKLNCESLKSLNAPEILDLSCDSDISRQIFNMEDKFGSSSDRIVYSCVVIAKPSHTRCLLVLSENRVYLIDIDCIYWPLPSFEAESEEMLQIGVMQNHPITDRISNISMYSAVSKVKTSKSQMRETNVRFAEFGLSMIFHETAGPKLFDVLFPSTSSRDFYLDRLTNLRAEHAHRMSPTLREEPEGGNELVHPPDPQRIAKLPTASSLPSSFDISKYYVSKTHTSVKTLPPEIKIETSHPPEPVTSDNLVHYASVKKHTTKEAIYSPVDLNIGEIDSLVMAYLSGELECHLKMCIRDYKLIHSLPTKLKPFALMDGRDLATFFHTVIAGKTSPDRGGLMEELHHVLWTNVVPYSNPKMEIPTLVMLSTRGIYFVSDSSLQSKSSSRPPWMTHARHQSDSAFAWKTDVGKEGSDRSVHKIKKRGSIKPYCVLKYSDLQQVNVGLFDQCIRLTGQDAHSVFTLAIRESVATGNFLQSMNGVLSLLATSPMVDKDKQDLEQDFYKAFTKRTKSTIEGLEYTHPSQVRFCYPGEDAIEDILYLVKEKVLPNNSKQSLWMYILGYVVPEEFLTGSTDHIVARTIILSSTHICLAEEDIVTYPLPDFVRGLPENPQHLIVESRKIENLKRVVLYSNSGNVIQLIFSDEKEELVVDASLDYFSEETMNKGREPRPEFCVRLFIQSPSEKEKFLQLLEKHWKELNPEVGRILDIINE
ncbi:nischarin-like isoform X2 [Haliotis cracherodii]|uniref:nischarin-like isoform X2 n=1 Tax=Haliotis cracherodii TaxID=6455 RepID=UPI0039ED28B7